MGRGGAPSERVGSCGHPGLLGASLPGSSISPGVAQFSGLGQPPPAPACPTRRPHSLALTLPASRAAARVASRALETAARGGGWRDRGHPGRRRWGDSGSWRKRQVVAGSSAGARRSSGSGLDLEKLRNPGVLSAGQACRSQHRCEGRCLAGNRGSWGRQTGVPVRQWGIWGRQRPPKRGRSRLLPSLPRPRWTSPGAANTISQGVSSTHHPAAAAGAWDSLAVPPSPLLPSRGASWSGCFPLLIPGEKGRRDKGRGSGTRPV